MVRPGCLVVALMVVAGVGAPAWAFEVRPRWVERIGTVDTPLPGVPYQVVGGQVVTLRVQLGVFGDAGGPAPAGGVVGWTGGSITGHAYEPGAALHGSNAARLNPFNSSPPPGFAGTQDPVALTDIDATINRQTLAWNGVPGTPDPGVPPPAVVRGLGTFVSTFTIRLTFEGIGLFDVTAAGSALVASAWNIAESVPPEPGADGLFGTGDAGEAAGSVTYQPVLLPPVPMSVTGYFANDPAPAGAAVVALGVVLAGVRRRR